VAHTSVLVGHEILIIGGGDGKQDGNTLAILDTEIGSWEEPAAEGHSPRARYGHTACFIDERVYVFGGYSVKVSMITSMFRIEQVITSRHGQPISISPLQIGYSNDLTVLDTENMVWSAPYTNGSRPQARVGHGMAFIAKNIFIHGGSQADQIFGTKSQLILV
jgi:hypothetical protein